MDEPSNKGWSSGKKWLFGCAGGGLTTVFVLAIVAAVVIYYAVRAVPILPPETFLVRKTDAFVVARITKDDKGVIKELQKVLTELPQIADMSKEATQSWRQQSANAEEALASAGPLQVVLVQQVSPDGETKRAMVVSIRRLSGFFRWTVNWSLDALPAEGGSLEDYEATTIGTSKDGISVAARGNNFMFSQEADVIKHWIDRVKGQRLAESEAGEGEAPAPPVQMDDDLKSLYESMPAGVPVRFGLNNKDGQLEALLTKFAKQDAYESLDDVGLFGRNVNVVGGSAETDSGSTGRVQMKLLCKDAQTASEVAGRLENKLHELEQILQIEKLQVNQNDSKLDIDFLVPNMWNRLRKALMSSDVGKSNNSAEGSSATKASEGKV